MQEEVDIRDEPVVIKTITQNRPLSANAPAAQRQKGKRQTRREDANKLKPPRKKRTAACPKKGKKRSRSAEECDKAISFAKKYLEEHPQSLNLNCENMLTLKSIRDNMEKDRQNFISQRVIALVAEDVVKDEYKTKLLKQYISELDNIQQNFPEEDINSVEGEQLYQSFERVLDNIEIESDDDNCY